MRPTKGWAVSSETTNKLVRVEDLDRWIRVEKQCGTEFEDETHYYLPQIDPVEIGKQLKEENNAGNTFRHYHRAIDDFVKALEGKE